MTELSEQCEQLAYDQLLSYVQLLKSTGRLQLTHQQAQTLSSEQLGAVVLGKEQSKEFGGVTTAQVRLRGGGVEGGGVEGGGEGGRRGGREEGGGGREEEKAEGVKLDG